MIVSDNLGVASSSAGTSGDECLLIEFELAGESYGVEISAVREIIRVQEITRVPGVPDGVEGIINLRGVVVPIVDLRKRLGVAVIE
jgi:purine-binding chemotaxis protein CheW